MSKKTVEKILLSQVILIVQKSDGHQFEKKSAFIPNKKNFSTGKRYRCVFVSSKHQPILQEKKMAEKPIPREATWKATELGVYQKENPFIITKLS